METIKNIRLSLFCGIYALFYTFCLYKNYSGVTFPFFAVGTLCFFLYYMKRQGLTIKRFSVLTAAVILALSINICLTDSIYLAVFDRCFIFLLFFTLFLNKRHAFLDLRQSMRVIVLDNTTTTVSNTLFIIYYRVKSCVAPSII